MNRQTAEFDEFWAAYPRRVGKGDARKVWARLKPSRELLNAMLSALAWQSNTPQWKRDGGQYVPHPATWLRQERWEDEPFETLQAPRTPRLGAEVCDAFDRASEAIERLYKGHEDRLREKEERPKALGDPKTGKA